MQVACISGACATAAGDQPWMLKLACIFYPYPLKEKKCGLLAGRSLTALQSTALAAAPSSDDAVGFEYMPLAPGPAPASFSNTTSTSQTSSTAISLGSALSANSTEAAIQAANTVNVAACGLPPCGTSCALWSIGSAAQLNNHFYLQYGATTSCDFFYTQYSCCIQACQVDADCPSTYQCLPSANAGPVCTLCDSCGSTTNTKCQADQKCRYPCCLTASQDACYVPGLGDNVQLTDAADCCPSSDRSGSNVMDMPDGVSSCTCNSPQTCPSLLSPSPETPQSSPEVSPELSPELSPSPRSPSSPLPAVSCPCHCPCRHETPHHVQTAYAC